MPRAPRNVPPPPPEPSDDTDPVLDQGHPDIVFVYTQQTRRIEGRRSKEKE